jgi:hypothetical protein
MKTAQALDMLYLHGSSRGNIIRGRGKGQQERLKKMKSLGGRRERDFELSSFSHFALERDACVVLMKD